MTRIKRFIEKDVLSAARERISHIYDIYDTVAVSFSGGKDSLVVLHLALEEQKRRGIAKLKVVFRDEELIPDSVINFVDGYRRREDIEMQWFCVPLKSAKYILGRTYDYVQWAEDRPHVRAMPEWGIKAPQPGMVFDQYTMDEFACRPYSGKVCLMTGIRAAESLIRFRSSVNKLNENYLTHTETRRIMLGKPIYDWQENDIFRYLYDSEVSYARLYDAQAMAGESLRVSTPLHAEAAKKLDRWRVLDPVFYDRVLQVFPEVAVQARYWNDLDRAALVKVYGNDFAGVRRYVHECITDQSQQESALSRLDVIEGMAAKNPRIYPPAYVLKYIIGGQYKRMLLPMQGGKKDGK
jgi:predicted phosphoadenosine phosphosulfate sulfurtransferase